MLSGRGNTCARHVNKPRRIDVSIVLNADPKNNWPVGVNQGIRQMGRSYDRGTGSSG